jgi:ATP-dependent Clp protease ATP-binding subunit ClpX
MAFSLKNVFPLVIASFILISNLYASQDDKDESLDKATVPYGPAAYEVFFDRIKDLEDPAALKTAVETFITTYSDSLTIPLFYYSLLTAESASRILPARLITIDGFVRDLIMRETKTLDSSVAATARDLSIDDVLKLTAMDIKTYLAERIIGEEEATQALAVAAHRHLHSVYVNQMLRGTGTPLEPIRKTNVFMVGPSGCGKTASVRHLANLLKLAFFEADASSLTRTGIVGNSVGSMVEGLLAACNYNVSAARIGIIFIDEFDKIAAKCTHGACGVGGDDVQAELLKLIEGKDYSVTQQVTEGEKTYQMTSTFNTSHILFIVGGAFTTLPKKPDLGYTFEDFIEVGMKPELMGRFSKIICFEGMTKAKLGKILQSPRISPLLEEKTMMKLGYNIDIDFDEACLDLIAEKASILGTGARALTSIVSLILEPIYVDSARYRGQSVTIGLSMVPKKVLKLEKKSDDEYWKRMVI